MAKTKVVRGPSLRASLYTLCQDITSVQKAQEDVRNGAPGAKESLDRKLELLEQGFAELVERHVAA